MYGSNKVQVVETMCRTGQGHESIRVEKSPQMDASQGHIASQLMYYAVAPRYAVSWRLETLLTRAVVYTTKTEVLYIDATWSVPAWLPSEIWIIRVRDLIDKHWHKTLPLVYR